ENVLFFLPQYPPKRLPRVTRYARFLELSYARICSCSLSPIFHDKIRNPGELLGVIRYQCVTANECLRSDKEVKSSDWFASPFQLYPHLPVPTCFLSSKV